MCTKHPVCLALNKIDLDFQENLKDMTNLPYICINIKLALKLYEYSLLAWEPIAAQVTQYS